ncbi:glycerol-3-phosphatase [Arthrobacter mangrovi]|uniref:Glycerol-3-phosphatase n=1 Tax=Arthrobacter mangrovi TaxID=2966350 RepID=A0ABQ5MRN8_9MICC|nr:glycerol-3-phosphatase [Arthrobacter mangrovi]
MNRSNSGTERPVLAGLGQHVFEAVLFDMDGTLIDSTGAVERGWARWANELGFGDTYRHTDHGKPARDIVSAMVAPDQVEECLARVIEIETQETDGIHALEGAAALLGSIPPHQCAIVTSCTRGLAEVRLRAAGLNAPPVLISFDDIENGKPHPEGYLLAARRLGVAPDRCLVIEDTPAGLAAGRAAGCVTLAVAGTFSSAELVADAVLLGLGGIRAVNAAGGLRLETVS